MIYRSDTREWEYDVKGLKRSVQHRLFTYSEFTEELRNILEKDYSPFKYISIDVSCENSKILQISAGDNANNEKTLDSSARSGNKGFIDIRYLQKDRFYVDPSAITDIYAIIDEHVMTDALAKGFGVLDAQNAGVERKIAPTIFEWSQDNNSEIYVAYIDIDNFKTVNDQIGHNEGDKALKDVGSAIRKTSENNDMIGFRKGGDEYAIIFKSSDPIKIFEIIKGLRHEVSSKSYGSDNKNVLLDFTAGITLAKSKMDNFDFSKILGEAEATTKRQGNKGKLNKKRGTISFSYGDNYASKSTSQLSPEAFSKYGVCIIRSRAFHKSPFSNDLLNIISNHISSIAVQRDNSLRDEIQRIVSWLDIDLQGNLSERQLIGNRFANKKISPLAAALAISHGLISAWSYKSTTLSSARTFGNIKIEYSPDGSSVKVIRKNNSILWEYGARTTLNVGCGGPITSKARPKTIPLCIAVQIGMEGLAKTDSGFPLAEGLLGDIVVVDDRPSIGGGLPDFWQAAVAQVCTTACKLPSIKTVIILGDISNASQTVRVLEGTSPWDGHDVAKLANVPHQELEERVKSLFNARAIKKVTGSSQLIEELYKLSLAMKDWAETITQEENISAASLIRAVREDGIRLRMDDGIICSSPEEAYPIILELLRTSKEHATYDDASQRMAELIGFKVIMSAAPSGPVPNYWSKSHEQLQEYAKRVLLEKDSLIGRKFFSKQYQAVISHLANYCKGNTNRASTRRAIMTIPNIIEKKTLKPLGLVSVWATPKVSKNGCVLDFCFVWRTVEALVGFPYSSYGSVKLMEKMVEDVALAASRVNDKEGNHNSAVVKCGSLTYIALSLHMRTDPFHLNIAKQIVDSASS